MSAKYNLYKAEPTLSEMVQINRFVTEHKCETAHALTVWSMFLGLTDRYEKHRDTLPVRTADVPALPDFFRTLKKRADVLKKTMDQLLELTCDEIWRV